MDKMIWWIHCPVCGNKTRDRILEEIINVEQMNKTVIKEPAAKPTTNENETRGYRLFVFTMRIACYV